MAAGLMLLSSCSDEATTNRFPIGEITIDDSSLGVWVADEPGERRQGLRSVEELPEGIDGMLFVFPRASSLSFTMRDTLIPLDIWWFDARMTLIGHTAMEPCESDTCVSYGSPGDAQWALETPAGQVEFATGARLSIVENG